jgi:molecular chaperone DnaK (HSP70)
MSGWAIDLGTTNTGVARWDDDAERPRLVELPRVCRRPGGEDHLQAPRMVPSAVELAAPRGVWARMLAGQVLGRVFLGGDGALIGRMALERSEGERRPGFVPSFKRWLARDALHVLASAGGHSWTAREVAHAFLRQLLVEVRRETGERIRDLVLTTPVDTYESYRAELQGAARRLGVRRLRFLDEPVAAALGYDLGPRAARRVLVIDFGAGTLDVALVLLTPKGTLAGTCDVLAKDGRPLGGNDVDRWLLEDFCRRLDYPLREDDGSEEGRFWYRLMLDEARRVKEALFFAEEASFDLTPPEELRRFEAVVRGAGTELVVTRGEVMALLAARGVDEALGGCLDGVLARAAEQGVPAEAIDDVLMVGGSTLLPGIYARIEARFGRDRVRAWKPFEAVAWGAATFAAGRFSQSDHIVHDYALTTYDRKTHDPRYDVIIARGTRAPTRPDHWKQTVVPLCLRGEPETTFKLVICELGRAWGGEERLAHDTEGRLHRLSADGAAPLVVPLNASNPTLGSLSPPHAPGDRTPRLELAFGVNEDRWLIATVRDLKTRRVLMKEEPVVRLL